MDIRNVIQMYEQIKRETDTRTGGIRSNSNNPHSTRTSNTQQRPRQHQQRHQQQKSRTRSRSQSSNPNHRRSRSSSSKRSRSRSKINDAEIENVILKQILASSILQQQNQHQLKQQQTLNHHGNFNNTNNNTYSSHGHYSPYHQYQNHSQQQHSLPYLSNFHTLKTNSFHDDISIATSTNGGVHGGGCSASVISTFSTRDILGDLTDQEDQNHIVKSVVSVVSSACGHSLSGGDGGGSVVSGGNTCSNDRGRTSTSFSGHRRMKVALNDITSSNNNNNNGGGLSKPVVSSRKIRLKDGGGGDGEHLYESFMKNLSIQSPFDSGTNVDKAITTANVNPNPNANTSSKRKVLTKQKDNGCIAWDPFDNSFDIDNDAFNKNNNNLKNSSDTKQLVSKPVPLCRHSSAPKYYHDKNKAKVSSSKSDFQPSPSFLSSSLTDRNSLVKAVYSFTEANAVTKKSRPKQFVEDCQVTALSPIRTKNSSPTCTPTLTTTTTADNEVNIELDLSFSSQNTEWTAFSPNNDKGNYQQNHDFESWASFGDHHPNMKKNDTKTLSSSSSFPKSKNDSFWNFDHSPFETKEGKKQQQQRQRQRLKHGSNNNDYKDGFQIVEPIASKQMEHYSNDLFKAFDGKDCGSDFFTTTTNVTSTTAPDDWDEFHDSSSLNKSDDSLNNCELSKLSTSSISFGGSLISVKHGSLGSSSNGTLAGPSTSRSFQHYRSESLFPFTKEKSSTPTLLKGSPKDTDRISVWTDQSPSGVADFD